MRVEPTTRPSPQSAWTPQDAARLYRIPTWSERYFEVGDSGHLMVRPDPDGKRVVDLYEIVQGLRARDVHPPMVVRFSDILAHRLRHLRDAFASAIEDNDYRGQYIAVYPVKVNQQRFVVEEIYRIGEPHGSGLEVGSKPELLAVMAIAAHGHDRPIICNGFKDEAYIEAVILATKLGRTIIPVVEKFDELELILKHARRYAVRPRIGVRVKLAAEGAGRWKESSGARSKFGLFISEILELVAVLRREGLEDCLQLVHCHPGSQLHDIRRIKDAIAELAHVYAELCAMGAGLRYIDIGGGLGVDYDGSGSNSASSINYTLAEYAADVVYRIVTVCNARGLEHPTIISESGRAIAAHSSVLVIDVLGSASLDHFRLLEAELEERHLQQPVIDLFDAYREVAPSRLLECYHDAVQAHDSAVQMFGLGYLSLRERALAERVFWATCARIRDEARRLDEVPQELEALSLVLSDTYFCNFSVFQSLPDAWAIDQLFPIVPLQRLEEPPTREAVVADITCDSDGRIGQFVAGDGHKPTLPVHRLRDGEPYYLGIFLVGAYQETLGDLHNLFGDTHVAHIRLAADGGWWPEGIVQGDTAAELLGYMQFDVHRLYPRIVQDCEHAVRAGRMTLEESQVLRRFYETELRGYSYLEPPE